MKPLYLRELAHARAGDKGDTSILSLFPLYDNDYEWLQRHVTARHVRKHLAEYITGDVVRFEVPLICGLQFVCTNALGGGVTTSLALDTHGKSLSSRLLGLRIPNPADTQRGNGGTLDSSQ